MARSLFPTSFPPAGKNKRLYLVFWP
jgi:hypothetical protein